MPPETFPMLLIALSADALFGYPSALLKTLGHPVMWIGALINLADRRLNREDWGAAWRRICGLLSILTIVAITACCAALIQWLAGRMPYGSALTALAASTLLASRSLYEHVSDVAAALDRGGLQAGRAAVSRIAGRDPESLDGSGVARAAIESLAENASDGIVAPALWFALLGLPGLAAYKAINTADSMIGHRTPRHEAFGWAAARLDDIVNLPASRLTALLLVFAAPLTSASSRGAIQAVLRDAGRHRSPNAGWPEAAMAGALNLKLAGPRIYAGVTVDDAFMGDGRREANPKDIWDALRLAKNAWIVLIAAVAALAYLTALS
jgi:adenosylcobinamide-phosphate synthase